jgi:hypothetical protein
VRKARAGTQSVPVRGRPGGPKHRLDAAGVPEMEDLRQSKRHEADRGGAGGV